MTIFALSLALAAAAVSQAVLDESLPVQDEATTEEAAQEPEQEPRWEGALTVGVSISDGNTDIQKASATADAVKEMDGERYSLGFSWNFSGENGLVNQRKTYGKAQYDHFLNERLYWLAQTSAEADDQAGVDLRTTLGGGLGYQFKDTEAFKLDGEMGLTWFNEEFDTGVDKDYIAVRMAAKWTYKLSDHWAFEQSAAVFPSIEDSEDVYSKIDTRAKATLTENMFAQLQWVWDWDNTPAAGNERSDHLYLLTVGWKF